MYSPNFRQYSLEWSWFSFKYSMVYERLQLFWLIKLYQALKYYKNEKNEIDL